MLKAEKEDRERTKDDHEMTKKSYMDENDGLKKELKKILTTINV
jgi:hypothetical protein